MKPPYIPGRSARNVANSPNQNLCNFKFGERWFNTLAKAPYADVADVLEHARTNGWTEKIAPLEAHLAAMQDEARAAFAVLDGVTSLKPIISATPARDLVKRGVQEALAETGRASAADRRLAETGDEAACLERLRELCAMSDQLLEKGQRRGEKTQKLYDDIQALFSHQAMLEERALETPSAAMLADPELLIGFMHFTPADWQWKGLLQRATLVDLEAALERMQESDTEDFSTRKQSLGAAIGARLRKGKKETKTMAAQQKGEVVTPPAAPPMPATAPAPTKQKPHPQVIKRVRIHAWPDQPRKFFDEAELYELADSVKEKGVLQTPLVRPHPDLPLGEFMLIAGERRWQAAGLAGVEELLCVVHYVNDEEALELAIIENGQRSDISPIEEAWGYQALADKGWTQEKIGQRVSKDRATVANRMRLAKLPPDVQKLLSGKKPPLSAAQGIAIARFSEYPLVALLVAEDAVKYSRSSHDLEKGFFVGYAVAERRLGISLQDARFDWRTICPKCPFRAFVKGRESYSSLCLNRNHFDELQEAALIAQRSELIKAQEAAREAGATLTKLSEWKTGSIVGQDFRPPTGCSTECPCRCKAINDRSYGENKGKVVEICTDGKRRSQLAENDRRAVEAEKQRRVDALRSRVSARLGNETTSIPPRDANVMHRELCAAVFSMLYSTQRSEIVQRAKLCMVYDVAALFESAAGTSDPIQEKPYQVLDMLLGHSPATLVRFAATLAVLGNLARNSYRPERADLAHWYAGNEGELPIL